MTRRRARATDKFRISTLKGSDGRPVRRGSARTPRWDWWLEVDPRSTDDQVLLPRVYHRPVSTRHGIRQELVLDWDSPRPRVKLDSHNMACLALKQILWLSRRAGH